MPHVFLDTTCFHGQFSLDEVVWARVQEHARRGVHFATSEVNVRELLRQADEAAAKAAIEWSKARTVFTGLGAAVPDGDPLFKRGAYELFLRTRLHALQIAVLPVPTHTHTEILGRDLGVQPPFDRSGKGYRDTLIWLSFLEWLRLAPTPVAAYFVTENSSDFGRGELKAELATEVSSLGDVRIEAKLNDLLKKLHDVGVEPPHSDLNISASPEPGGESREGLIRDAVSRAVTAAVDEDISIDRDDTAQFDLETGGLRLPDLRDRTIRSISLGQTMFGPYLVDQFSGGEEEIWEASFEAELEIGATIHHSDTYLLPPRSQITSWQWSNQHANVRIPFAVELTFGVQLNFEEQEAQANLEALRVIG